MENIIITQKFEKLISILESRSEELRNEFNSKNNIEGLTNEQSRDVKIHKIGEAQGIDLCVIQIKKIITKNN